MDLPRLFSHVFDMVQTQGPLAGDICRGSAVASQPQASPRPVSYPPVQRHVWEGVVSSSATEGPGLTRTHTWFLPSAHLSKGPGADLAQQRLSVLAWYPTRPLGLPGATPPSCIPLLC